MSFIFWAVQTSEFQRLVGLSFFSAAQNVMGIFYLASPRHPTARMPPKAEPSMFQLF